MPKILIVDDEKIAVANLVHIMSKENYQVISTTNGPEALRLLQAHKPDVLLTDLRMEKVDGMQLLQFCRQNCPHTAVIMLTGFATIENAVEAMRQGAFGYLAKPFRLDEVRQIVSQAMEAAHLRERLAIMAQENSGIVSSSPSVLNLLEIAKKAAQAGCNVLITGESGVGKELFARFIHHSRKESGPFVAVNCGAFTEDLLANELFGHVKGAFTGALNDKKGLIEAASGGILFLDEVSEMPPSMQVKLLRVIQEKELLRLGGTEAIKVDLAFIAASNKDLQQAISKGEFRKDLFFRLNVINLHIPPLRERKEDIPLLVQSFLGNFAVKSGKNVKISSEALACLQEYDFPGNVRELGNILERAFITCQNERIEVTDLPSDFFPPQPLGSPSLEEKEKEYILQVLRETGGNQTLAAKILGIDRVSLWRKLKRFAITAPNQT